VEVWGVGGVVVRGKKADGGVGRCGLWGKGVSLERSWKGCGERRREKKLRRIGKEWGRKLKKRGVVRFVKNRGFWGGRKESRIAWSFWWFVGVGVANRVGWDCWCLFVVKRSHGFLSLRENIPGGATRARVAGLETIGVGGWVRLDQLCLGGGCGRCGRSWGFCGFGTGGLNCGLGR